MRKEFKAIKYYSELDLAPILKEPKQSINIFLPEEVFIPENPALIKQLCYGPRPYHIKSDVLAIAAHMGILYPGEKTKKNMQHVPLLTTSQAQLFGRADINFDKVRRIEDDFRFFGVVIQVTAVKPKKLYRSAQGFGIKSQPIQGTNPVAIDITDYLFITEFEPMPEIVKDPHLIVTTVNYPERNMPEDTDRVMNYSYSPLLFREDKKGLIFKDYTVTFFADDGRYILRNTRNKFVLMKSNRVGTNPHIETNISFSDISFNEKNIKVGNTTISNITLVSIQPNDEYF